MNKKIKLQQREYASADGKTKYKQHRINIPDEIIQKLQWYDENQLMISIESRNGKKRMILKTKP